MGHSARIYLDNAATTQPLPEVILAMGQALNDAFGNPSSMHADGREAKTLIETARREIARLLDAPHGRLFFTSGGTESIHTVLYGARKAGVRRIISSRTEHPAATSTLKALAGENPYFLPEKQMEVVYIGVDKKGRLSLGELDAALKAGDTPAMVSWMHANNETGVLHDLRAIGELCQKYRALFHTDAVQTVGHLPLNLSELPVDFLSASAHKFHGPKGTGLLYVRQPEKWPAALHGGGQERGMRSGTENVAGIAGMACALRIAIERMNEDGAHVRSLKKQLMEGLAVIEGIRFNGAPHEEDQSLPGIVNITLPVRKDPSLVLLALDMVGIEVSSGSACMAGIPEPSSVLAEMYMAGDEMAGHPSIRISIGRFNTAGEIRAAIEALKTIV